MDASVTLNQVLESFGKLSAEEQDMMLEIARKRRAEADHRWLAQYARKVRRDVAAGKLKPEPLSVALKRLHRLADAE